MKPSGERPERQGEFFALQFTCGIFVTLGKCFRLITLLGDFPVRMSQLAHVRGACGMGVETILLIVILAFAAGFVLDRLVIRQGRLDASKKEE